MVRFLLTQVVGCLLCGACIGSDPVPPLSSLIDSRINASIELSKIKASPRSTDEEFLRRVYLDLLGRIPSVIEARDFLEDRASTKRSQLVDRLLSSPGFAVHSARLWRSMLVPQATNNPQTQYLGVSIEAWIRQKVRSGSTDDIIVRDLLTTRLDYLDWTADRKANPGPGLSPVGFYQANDLKPETVGSAVGRTFLGLKLECALCHNHPFDKWTQKQAWETAAFFAGVAPLEPVIDPRPGLEFRRELKITDSETLVTARFLDGTAPNWTTQSNPRKEFATWLTQKNNPYFPKVMVNRIWANFFGVGIVDPLDDWGPHNPPSHPELLDELARAYADGGFDSKSIIRAILLSESYQRTSRMIDPRQSDPRLFTRMNVKGLSAEQLFDSFALATGYRDQNPPIADLAFGWPARSPRGLFIAKFGGGSGRTDMQASILQALSLMNGNFGAVQTNPEKSLTLQSVATAPFMDDSQRLDILFLGTLSRLPDKLEKTKYLTRIQDAKDKPKALADLLWVLTNTQEFLVNH